MVRRDKKRLLPLILLILIFWGSLLAIVFLVDPFILRDFPFTNSYLAFFLIFFFAWFFLLTLLMNNTRRGFYYSLGLSVFLALRLIRLGNIVNGVLLLSLLVVIDFYFTNR